MIVEGSKRRLVFNVNFYIEICFQKCVALSNIAKFCVFRGALSLTSLCLTSLQVITRFSLTNSNKISDIVRKTGKHDSQIHNAVLKDADRCFDLEYKLKKQV